MAIMFCQGCKTFGTPKRILGGSGGLGNFLKLFFPFNLIHYIWSRLASYKACRKCGGRNLIPEKDVDDNMLGMIVGGKDYVENRLREGKKALVKDGELLDEEGKKDEEW